MQEKELLRELCIEFMRNPRCVGIDRVPIKDDFHDNARYYTRGGEQYFYSILHSVGDSYKIVHITKDDAEHKTVDEILREED